MDEFNYKIYGYLEHHNDINFVYQSGDFKCYIYKNGERRQLRYKGSDSIFPPLRIISKISSRCEFIHTHLKNIHKEYKR